MKANSHVKFTNILDRIQLHFDSLAQPIRMRIDLSEIGVHWSIFTHTSHPPVVTNQNQMMRLQLPAIRQSRRYANERVCAEVGGLPKQDWSLRVTQVFRREAIGWQLVHRHADPLANGIGLRQAAALALGVADDRHAAQ